MRSRVAGNTVSLMLGQRRRISARAASRPAVVWARWTARRSAGVVMGSPKDAAPERAFGGLDH